MGLGSWRKNASTSGVFADGNDVCESVMRSAAQPLVAALSSENTLVAEGLKRHDPELLDDLIVQYQHRLLRYLLVSHWQSRDRRRHLPGNLDARAQTRRSIQRQISFRHLAVHHRVTW